MNGVWKWKSGISLFPYYQGYDNMFYFSIKRANLKSAKKKGAAMNIWTGYNADINRFQAQIITVMICH